MKVSVVIATFNRSDLANNLAIKIRKLNPDVETLVIDQSGSKPNLCKARNLGISRSKGDVVIFFDDDVEVTLKTITSHLLEYKNSNTIGVAGRVINDGESVPSNTNVETGKVNILGTSFVKNFWGEKRQNVAYPYGCNMSFRKSALDIIGKFDEKFPPPLSSFEEIDLGLRVSKIGNLIFSPDALVYHHRAKTGGTRTDNKVRNKLYYQSYGRLIRKHIKFPLNLISIGVIKLRILKEAPYALLAFAKGLLMA